MRPKPIVHCAAFVAALLVLACVAHAQIADGPYYARGSFYCSADLLGIPSGAGTCWGYADLLLLYDDGLHDDGAASDGVYGCWVTTNQPPGMLEFKLANADWTFNAPNVPQYALANGVLFTTSAGESVHFLLDTTTPAYGWVPAVSVANDHGYPAGATLELIGSAPELGSWTTGVPASHEGTLWSAKVMIATPGSYEYKFRVQGTWSLANFGIAYNNAAGGNGNVTTTRTNEDVVFQFDERTGRIRAIDDANVPIRSATWGHLKTVYR